MANSTAYKRFLSLVLVLVLIVPTGVKLTHHMFVEHEHCHLHGHEHEHGSAAIDREHKICPICAFDFVEFFSDENPPLTGSPLGLSDYFPAFIQQLTPTITLFLFYLRGPPLHS